MIARIVPLRVHSLESSFPAAAPTFKFLLARNRIVQILKLLKPNEPRQLIPFRKTSNASIFMLVQTARIGICNRNVHCRTVFVGENVHPGIVVRHRTRSSQRCFGPLNMTVPSMR
jgi:hypothetical protein